jgi:hypothetical protein
MSTEEEYNDYTDNIDNETYLPLNYVNSIPIQDIKNFMNKYYNNINVYLGFLYYYLHEIKYYNTLQNFEEHITMCFNKYQMSYRRIFNNDLSLYNIDADISKINKQIKIFFKEKERIITEKLKDSNKYKYLSNTIVYFINEYNISIISMYIIEYIFKNFINNYNNYFNIQ